MEYFAFLIFYLQLWKAVLQTPTNVQTASVWARSTLSVMALETALMALMNCDVVGTNSAVW